MHLPKCSRIRFCRLAIYQLLPWSVINLKYCKRCGLITDEDIRTCPSCQNKLLDLPRHAVPSKKPWLIAICLALIAVLLVSVLLLFILKPEETIDSTNIPMAVIPEESSAEPFPEDQAGEPDYWAFLHAYPEYNYYALLDINQDGIAELLATDWVYEDYTSSYNSVDLFLWKNGAFSLAYDNLWSQPFSLCYDSSNRWLHCDTNGTGMSGHIFVSLDKNLNVQEKTIEYCLIADKAGNESTAIYYNGADITDTACEAYEQLIHDWESGNPETVYFEPIPKSAPMAGEGYVHSYALGTETVYDLDGDGTDESISVTVADGTVRLSVNDITKEFEAWFYDAAGYYTIINIDAAANTLLIGVSDYGPSDDEMTLLYAYDGADIQLVGQFDQVLGKNQRDYTGAVCNGDGTISAETRVDVLATWFASAMYQYKGGQLLDITQFYECLWGQEAETKYGMTMYLSFNDESTGIMVPAGTAVQLAGVQYNDAGGCWAALKSADFEKMLWVTVDIQDWPQYVSTAEGILPSEEVFDGFFYAG